MVNYETEQENFWAGEFGSNYTERNNSEKLVASNIALFSKIINRTEGVRKCLEIGSNRGLNLIALGGVCPGMNMQAIEINESAACQCEKIHNVNVFKGTVFDFEFKEGEYDLSFTKGVLIHIAPNKLKEVYEILYKSSNRYVLIAEYYNPTPVEISYRGNRDKLYKRDFAGEMLSYYSDLSLVDYGFVYHGDKNFPQDDITWFLMEKRHN